MILLLDLGNSRIKWALAESGVFLMQGVTDSLFSLDWSNLSKPRRVLGCSVVNANQRQSIELAVLTRWGLAVEWLMPSPECSGVRSHYDSTRLGPDRWAAVLGAHARFPGQSLVVASAGTALVVDALTAQGEFLGGMILPGYRMMKTALAGGTAHLAFMDGDVHPFPQTTRDAIETGCITAMLGAVTAMVAKLDARDGGKAKILLSGGDASRLAAYLPDSCLIVDNLALYGLATLDEGGTQ